MSSAPIELSAAAARRFLRAALHLDEPHANVSAALAYHGYVQIDPINVCGRMHDLILRNRVAGYREHDLLRHLYGDAFESGAPPASPEARGGFEHYAGVLVALPWEAWPFLQEEMERRRTRRGSWDGKLSRPEEKLAAHILAEITAHGPRTSDDIEHDGRALTAWGTSGRAVKTVLEKLFFHGRVLITTRRGFRRVYDLPERVVPPAVLAQPRPTSADARHWRARLTLRQRRLVAFKRPEIPHLPEDAVAVRIPGAPPLHCLREDLALLERCARETAPLGSLPNSALISPLCALRSQPALPLLLAPLDPLIYDRRLARALWDFDYTWEVYTPLAKRVRGYYALPVLAGDAIVGHVDPKAERERRKLGVVSRSVRRGHVTRDAVRALAKFLGLRVP